MAQRLRVERVQRLGASSCGANVLSLGKCPQIPRLVAQAAGTASGGFKHWEVDFESVSTTVAGAFVEDAPAFFGPRRGGGVCGPGEAQACFLPRDGHAARGA